ncbi:uncharacterized protein BX664DRAFT_382450 [Halteromyces radiatus]|uniref:uncharacterized protein n=1 Tax=Halteromyces radiatus TaxID=101107 RepID=UPI00222119A1|nr:uncharacterized protein BX664DRAFT_382450 [Halteromyces radiatus]KAI8099992.1 hypothetical protein BX664DRAFT_382450 [Halteromyces radiatus]
MNLRQTVKNWYHSRLSNGSHNKKNNEPKKDDHYEEAYSRRTSIFSTTTTSPSLLRQHSTSRQANNDRSNSSSIGTSRPLSTANPRRSSTRLRRTSTTVKLRQIPVGGRRVFFNLPLPTYEKDKRGHPKKTYVTNKIRTSKYTWWTFIPKNLFEQFRRAANMYFLAMAILQMLPAFGVKSPALTLLPICAVVFISAVKDGFEDYQRHKVDAKYNGTITHTLLGYNNPNYPSTISTTNNNSSSQRHATSNTTVNDDNKGYFGPALSKDVRVGDILLLRNGESCPADCILLSSSDDENGICFVETKDLDGETNLKPRSAVHSLMHLQSGHDCLQRHFYVETASPSPDLYSYEGTIALLEKKQQDSNTFDEVSKTPLSIDHLILRGHVIRNTPWAIAVVIFTGTDTKIMLNSGETPSKRSQIEKRMNSEILIAFGILMILCLVCAIMAGVEKYQDDRDGGTKLYSQQDSSPAFVGFINFWSSLIIFQNIIPISLYVSIEFVKTFQAYFIWSDLDMWDENSKTSCIPKSWNLSDDLGQIEYLFSDKTGTLTRNVMEFRECTVNGQRYGNNGFAPETEGARGARLRRQQQQQQQSPTIIPLIRSNDDDSNNINVINSTHHDDTANVTDEKHQVQQRLNILDEYKKAMQNLFTPIYASTDLSRLSFADPRLMQDLAANDEQGSAVKEFFTLLAVCHTVVVERIGKDGKTIVDDTLEGTDNDNTDDDSIQKPQVIPTASSSSSSLLHNTNNIGKKKGKWHPSSKLRKKKKKHRGESLDAALSDDKDDAKWMERVDTTVQDQLEYKAESPDEAALVLAARNAGFAFIGRQGNKQLMVNILGKQYTFDLLHVFDFTSTRKRMSVIVRRPAPWHDIVLYSKGADNVMYARLDQDLPLNKARMAQTQQDIDDYSNDGLRTLVLGYRTLEDDDYFREWQHRMQEASTAVEGRNDKINALQDELEEQLILLGATAIEDKLQEGVPQCIEDLRHAGIKIWVLTGDKLETAINIGYASNLLDGTMKLWTVRDEVKTISDNDNDGDQRTASVNERLDYILGQIQQATTTTTTTTTVVKDDAAVDHPQEQDQQHALVIEGAALSKIYETEESKAKLLEVALQCKSVICCRVSPLQKALVVELVRRNQDAVTLAVGDGANDVSMIQAANVGIGIAGQEGVQASMAADYAISQFRFLQKLLLVQGHWSYERIAEMILNFFFKNIVWVFPALWYQIYSRFSGNLFYDYSFLQLYNLIFTVAPVVILGATDQDITSSYLKRYPQVYQIGIQKKIYTRLRFWIYFIDGLWQSVVVFYAFFFLYQTDANPNGYPDSMLQLSTSVAISVIILANMMPGFNTYYWTWWMFVFLFLEVLVTFLWVVAYGAFPSTAIYGMAYMVFGGWSFWLTFLVSLVVAFLPRYLCTFVVQWWFPDVMHQVRHVEMYERHQRHKGRRHGWCCFGERNRTKNDQSKHPV